MVLNQVYSRVIQDLTSRGFNKRFRVRDLGMINEFYEKVFGHDEEDTSCITVVVSKKKAASTKRTKMDVYFEASEDNSTAPQIIPNLEAWNVALAKLDARIKACEAGSDSDEYKTESDDCETESDSCNCETESDNGDE
jgi:hypothetical protein